MKALRLAAFFLLCLTCRPAFAGVAVESSVNRTRVAVGEELTLDLIVTNANGSVSRPRVGSIDGFTSYSQGHSQEISTINGQTTSRSIFSYVLIANSPGPKKIGPFEIEIGGKTYTAAAVDILVIPDSSTGASAGGPAVSAFQPSGTVAAPPARALPQGPVSDKDIFVKVWIDKDTAYVNEPVTLTYTLYTRLQATYKGFEKEPETTGFWVEEFPPEKTVRRTEKIIGQDRYVVADVRKIALFATQPGVFTLHPGTLSTVVEVNEGDDFDTFFSYNIFGRRGGRFPSLFSQMVPRPVTSDDVTLTIEALPEEGKPADFSGAVGQFSIDSSVDKDRVTAGDAVTFRVRLTGEGNLNTVELPALKELYDFKIYDSSTSTQITKERLKVEGQKTVETVIVPKKEGAYTIPSLSFSFFDPLSRTYRTIKTPPHLLAVAPGAAVEEEPQEAAPAGPVQPSEKREVSVLGQDIRYIKTQDSADVLDVRWHARPLGWLVNAGLALAALVFYVLGLRRAMGAKDSKNTRARLAGQTARKRLRSARSQIHADKQDVFYDQLSCAFYGFFADKFGVAPQTVSPDLVEEKAGDAVSPKAVNDAKQLFRELSSGRFGNRKASTEEMKEMFRLCERLIHDFEKAKVR